jgi:hypothetical protein
MRIKTRQNVEQTRHNLESGSTISPALGHRGPRFSRNLTPIEVQFCIATGDIDINSLWLERVTSIA